MSSMWCIDNALCPGTIFARDTDGLSRAYLGWNHAQETGGVPYPYPAQPRHRHPIALASPPLILYSETRHQPVQPGHQQPATQFIVGLLLT